MKRYDVMLERVIVQTGIVEVEAPDEDVAREAAFSEARLHNVKWADESEASLQVARVMMADGYAKAYDELAARLEHLDASGELDAEQEQALREQMDDAWWKLTSDERRAVRMAGRNHGR